MRARFFLSLLFTVAGCSDASLISAPTTTPLVSVVGPLTFSVNDFAAMGGVLWIQPTAEGGSGAISARAIRYGSLCATAVSAHADITGNTVVLHVAYTTRPGAVCTKEIRAIEYNAVIKPLSPGRYDVHILHSDDGASEVEVRRQSVDVG